MFTGFESRLSPGAVATVLVDGSTVVSGASTPAASASDAKPLSPEPSPSSPAGAGAPVPAAPSPTADKYAYLANRVFDAPVIDVRDAMRRWPAARLRALCVCSGQRVRAPTPRLLSFPPRLLCSASVWLRRWSSATSR